MAWEVSQDGEVNSLQVHLLIIKEEAMICLIVDDIDVSRRLMICAFVWRGIGRQDRS